jgi:hypothetical protein
MKKLFFIFIALISLVPAVFAQYDPLPPTAVIRPTISIRAARDLDYWKLPDAKNYWSWMPQVSFTMTGPVPDASFVTFEFFTPDGKPWYSWDTGPFSVAAGGQYSMQSEAVAKWWDKRSTILTGVFPFKITLKNNMNGTSKELYKGTFKVDKKFAGTPHPDFKNQWAYYVDQDWALPIGYLGLDSSQDKNAPFLNASMWFKGEYSNENLNAYLFYNGKQISSTKLGGQGSAGDTLPIIHDGDDDAHQLRWELWRFSFVNARAYADPSAYPNAMILSKNPGNYEIKVLMDGELVRTAAFTIGADGQFVNNGVANKNGFGALGLVMPVKITPTKEKIGNLTNWKTDAYYGNPLVGFIAQ